MNDLGAQTPKGGNIYCAVATYIVVVVVIIIVVDAAVAAVNMPGNIYIFVLKGQQMSFF